MKKHTFIKIVSVLISFVLVSGCASTKNTLAEAEAPTMKEIYHAHMNGTHKTPMDTEKTNIDKTALHQANDESNGNDVKPNEQKSNIEGGLVAHLQTFGGQIPRHENKTLPKALKKLQRTFSPLPNPVLLMYIPAHLTSGGTPVPGYSTYFSFYEREHIALPSERRALE